MDGRFLTIGAISLFLLAGVILAAVPDDLAILSDEFNDTTSLANWKILSEVESLPNRIEKIDINQTSPGNLYLIPRSAAWWKGYHGVFLFKEVTGDFMVTTRVRVTGKTTELPQNPWTISGLLVRHPGNNLKISSKSHVENWIYLMTGTGPDRENPLVIDSKSTINSENFWDNVPSRNDWVELRIIRIGTVFISMHRFSGGAWQVRNRHFRQDLPGTLQVGINATSDYITSRSMSAERYNRELFQSQIPPDSVTRYDYIRYRRVSLSLDEKEKVIKGVFTLPDSEILSLMNEA